ncbi:hypothetical protein XELAEV_18015316mg [Xenopus laevis]|uniref:CWF21 domain-containing protein n=1 Tax=Xenopus laevis TaxID=8355 RepID=A0A974DIX3_XENLA|nr:hypothetical protein XELAEV_18015316mg [Xenopus laevis]
MAVCNNGTRMPSPQETTNGFSQPCASGTWHKAEEESRTTEPNLVKKAHREILDHERKRRVELKCMELQEMMEEQGYSEEEIHQKVGTFRQMLMEKEGVLTREDQHGRQIVIENHYMVPGEESATEYSMYGEGYTLECECHSDWYRDDSSHRDYRTKRRLSSPASPPPKKRKKKKSSHKRSRCDSSSQVRKEKKKKSSKKHKRDRSNSGSRKKRRHRSRSPRNKKKDKIKDRKRSHSGSTTRRTHRHSSCSSHSASPSSDYSTSKSPKRQSPKHRQDGRKPSNQRSSRSLSSSCSGHSRSATTHQNGHKSGNHNGHHSDGIGNIQEKHLDRFNTMSPSSRIHVKVEMSPSQFKGKNRHDIRSPRSVSSSKGDRCSSEEKHHHRSKSASSERHHHRSRARNRSYKTCPANSGSHTGYSSDSEESVLSHTVGMDKNHGAPLKKKRVRRGRQNSCSEFSLKQPRQNSDRKKSPARSTGNRGSSWSSSCSPSRSRSREKRSVRSRSRSASQKKTANREKESDTKARHNDTEAARPRRRSRSYSPIRKRRRDSPSFMEARRITRFLLEIYFQSTALQVCLVVMCSKAPNSLLPSKSLFFRLPEQLLPQS